MKKTYIIPEIETIELQYRQQLLDGSLTLDPEATPVDPANADAPELILW